mgnify:CR=1 FL=1
MKAVCKRMTQPGGTLPGRGAAAGRANRGTPVSFVADGEEPEEGMLL